MSLNWPFGPHRDFGCAWATSLPNQATAKETAVKCPLKPNISTYHKVIFVCLVPIKLRWPKSLEGRLTGSKARTRHFYGTHIGSRCCPPHPISRQRGALTCFSLPQWGNPHFGLVSGPLEAERGQSTRSVCCSAAMWVWIGCLAQPGCSLAVVGYICLTVFAK